MAQPARSAAPQVPETAAGVLDVVRPQGASTVMEDLRVIAQQAGTTPIGAAQACLKLAFGPGKVTFKDYIKLRLFDPAFLGGADPTQFVGQRRNRDLNVIINWRHDWLGILSNKVAALSYLAAYGFPVAPPRAVYAPTIGGRPARASLLRDRSELAAFLADEANYPLFGKPVEGVQSLGAIALTACRGGEVERADGGRAPLAGLVEDVVTNYASGYLVQPLLRPDPAIAALCGQRLATVRLVTVLTEDGPRILRGAWKIPAGVNGADNYWRAGNLLAQIDLGTGRAMRATTGAGLTTAECERHPDTGVAVAGFQHPRWAEMRALALEGAGLMAHVPMIGWDLACTEEGPIVMEMNECPDMFLVQFADRRGLLDDPFQAFVAYQTARSAEYAKGFKAEVDRL